MADTPMTGAAIIAAAYPDRYYAIYDKAATTSVAYASDIVDTMADTTKINALPAAADMVPLTQAQWILAQTAPHIPISGGKLLYPDRFYAYYDSTASQPTMVIGFYDVWEKSSLISIPDLTNMIPIAPSDWASQAFRSTGKGVQGGKIIDYTPPVPLQVQARMVLAGVPAVTWAKFGSKGQTVPQSWVDYQDALQALADGADTASTELPAEPTTP